MGKRLSCHKEPLNDQLLDYLVIDLFQSPTLESINLPKNTISAERVEQLFQAIQHLPNIKSIELMENPIRAQGARHIAEILPHCQLEMLSLKGFRWLKES